MYKSFTKLLHDFGKFFFAGLEPLRNFDLLLDSIHRKKINFMAIFHFDIDWFIFRILRFCVHLYCKALVKCISMGNGFQWKMASARKVQKTPFLDKMILGLLIGLGTLLYFGIRVNIKNVSI